MSKPDKYKNGKIYKISSSHCKGIYIGSTTSKYLAIRLAQHKIDLERGRKTASSEIVKFDDAKIELLEIFPSDNKLQLLERENYWIEQTPNCVNKNLNALIFASSKKEYYAEYHKQYKDYRNEYRKNYRLEHRDELLIKKRQYYEKNKDKIIAKRSEVIKCECGKTYTSGHKDRHFRSQYHKKHANVGDNNVQN